MSDSSNHARTAETAAEPRSRGRLWFAAQFFGSLLLVSLVLAYLLRGETTTPPIAAPRTAERQAVADAGPGQVRIDPQSSLAEKLDIVQVQAEEVSIPELRVTGTVTASLRPGAASDEAYWQFDDPEVFATFYEWEKAQVDIAFATAQKERIEELSEARISAQKRVVERMDRLVQAGTDTRADLEQARAELIEREIESKRELHEAETAVWLARQAEAVLVRRLQLAGLQPEMFGEASAAIDVVVADVPEEYLARVYVGQRCEARFYGVPGEVFSGVVRSISPVLSRERRVVRVLFFVDDPDDQLRPGMFAEIGMGTDPREALLVPSESVLHVGRNDYVLVESGEQTDVWQVREVRVGDQLNGRVEVYAGLRAGDRVLGQGAILLKPAAVASLQPRQPTSAREAVQEEVP